MTITVENLTKNYGEQKAVDDITFEVAQGDIVGFLGPNGAGKSTTMKILSCFILPNSGQASINGYDIIENPDKVRQQIGYLPENNPLYEDMYIREYLDFTGQVFRLKTDLKHKINELVETIGLVTEMGKKIGELSKGFRQRVGLAQALIHDPEVLILDEPTSGLDPNQVVEIRKLIREVGKTKTVILSSHIMQEVQAMCNRVIIINKGKIVADNPIETLLAQSDKVKTELFLKNPASEEQLKTVSEISNIEQISTNRWNIYSSDTDLPEKLFHFSVSTQNVILEMKTDRQNLEEIFQQLTE